MTTLAGVHAVLPPHRYPQVELTAAFAELCLGADGDHGRRQREVDAARHMLESELSARLSQRLMTAGNNATIRCI